jgi:hypothetical protein
VSSGYSSSVSSLDVSEVDTPLHVDNVSVWTVYSCFLSTFVSTYLVMPMELTEAGSSLALARFSEMNCAIWYRAPSKAGSLLLLVDILFVYLWRQ